MADLDAIKARKLTWTPYRVDDAGNAWEWEGRAESTRIIVDPATHAYLVGVAIDMDALIAEVERLRKVAEAARGAAVCMTTQIREAHSGSLAWPHGPCGHCVGCRIRSALAELEGDDHLAEFHPHRKRRA